MVWIFFLSTNRKHLQRNQLSASILGPETHRQPSYHFQIESSGTFLTSHINTMLISHSVWNLKIESIPIVWIFFLSTDREYFQRNQLSASILGPETHGYCFHLFRIESSGTFLTNHISTMLYHIVSGTSKLGQFRRSGFFSYQQTENIFNGINYRHLSSDRKTHGYTFHLFQIESSGTFLTSHISTMLYHIVSGT